MNREQIKLTMMMPEVKEAVLRLEGQLAGLTPQQQIAAIALLAARQVSIWPDEAHASVGDIVGEMVEIGTSL